MSQWAFLILNGAVVILVVLSFFVARRGSRRPFRLRLLGDADGEVAVPSNRPMVVLDRAVPQSTSAKPGEKRRPPGWDNYRPRKHRSRASSAAAPQASAPAEKALNAVFNWNGHAWDAYEVLGLPAGSSNHLAEQAFLRASRTADPESLPFLRAAYDAILQQV